MPAFTYGEGKWLEPPEGQEVEILEYLFRPSPEVKPVDLCCGLGYGKTFIAVQAAALALNKDGHQTGLFLEPDWDRIETIFLPVWKKLVPKELYTEDKGNCAIHWYNGSILYYRPRVITGNKERSRDKFRGIPDVTFIIDDETAIGFDREQYENNFSRIRGDSDVRFYFTLSTPKVGPYGNFLKRGGNKVFYGRTADNVHLMRRDPDYEKRLRKLMSPEQAARELDGQLVALEGRIWKTAKWEEWDAQARNVLCAWPNGNRHDQWTSFRKGEPWWLFCDLGGATGAYAVVQQAQAEFRGRRLFREPVWVAVADFCPTDDASASRAFQKLKTEFGTPVAVVAGADADTRSITDGRTVSYFATEVFGSAPRILPCNENLYNKQIQYDRLSYLMCSAIGERRFTIARDFVSLDDRSKRGVREMVLEDAWPPEGQRRASDFLPKQDSNTVQHIRDALLMGASMVMAPPDWLYTGARKHAA